MDSGIKEEVLRNITIRPEDIKNDKFTPKFYARKDISKIKKTKIKEIEQKE